ncbi:hypothetical protein ACQRIU_002646 [Beauveria bassiana]
MPAKAGVWENSEFLMELSLALFQVASGGGALSTQAKSAVEAYLKAQGHDQSWESIRQHIQKLRKARDTSALDGSGDSSKLATPRKATPRKTPTSTRKHKVEMDEDADELGLDIKKEDEKGSMATPSKRPKIE